MGLKQILSSQGRKAMKSIGILVSSPIEAKAFSELENQSPIEIRKGVWLISSGMGEKNIKKAIAKLILKGIEGLISFGFAGGIDSLLTTGTITLPKQIIHLNGMIFNTNDVWRNAIKKQIPLEHPFTEKALVHTPSILYTPEDKNYYFQRSGGSAVDQESYFVGEMAFESSLPFLVVRVILDDATTSLPQNVDKLQDEKGVLNLKLLLKELLHITLWPDYYKLSRQYYQSHKVLERLSGYQLKSPDAKFL